MSKLSITTRLDQRLVLTPQLRQRIEMLQMTSIELADLIQQELISNPILEEVTPYEETREISENIIDQYADGEPESAETNYSNVENPEAIEYTETADSTDYLQTNGKDHISELENLVDRHNEIVETSVSREALFEGEVLTDESIPDTRDSFEEIDFGREFQDYLDPGYKTQEIEQKEDAPTFEQFLTRSESLTEHLEWQLNLSQINEELLEAALCVIGNLDGDGRLNATIEEIAAMCEVTPEVAEEARQFVMRLEPVGCAAYNVKECLMAQLEAQGEEDTLAADLIKNHLTELQPHKLGHLAKHLEIDINYLNDELQFIKTLDPYPGRRYASDEPIFIAPEIYIEKIEDDYVIYFADDGSPRLRISQPYQKILENGSSSKETRDFIKDKIRSAVDLLRNIEHRRQTIYRVVECIVHKQRDFLDYGVEHLKPMMLKDVAEDIGMHLSTISRAVNRKYAHTPQGVIELRRFFSEGMVNEDGEEVSTRIIKLRIKKLVEEEDSKSPITDDDIAKILAKEGIKLSRRTVAKYRDQMQIPGSRERKVVI